MENAHKKLEGHPPGSSRDTIIIEAAKEVGKPIFFSLLVITVSFMPVFTLEAQEGRLFMPLAFTKTAAMFFASLLSITLAPALMMLFLRGGVIRREEENPVNRFFQKIYQPLVSAALRFRWPVIAGAALIMLTTFFPLSRLGSEFMPPLNEGSILFMPTTLPGISIEEAKDLLQKQDKILKSFPEVETVFGKVGRAGTATDPAPLSMIETTVMLKPEKQWRKGLTWDALIDEMDSRLKFPGVTNAWTMPIKARIDMLTTGIRTPVGIKIFGDDLNEIAATGEKLEAILSKVPGTRSVFAERVTGGYFVDIEPRRQEIARYGLSVADINHMIEIAIGGMNIETTVEGRERYPINVRYAREFRQDVEQLRRVLVPTPGGPQIPLGQLADIELSSGPPMIKNEDGGLTGWVYVDVQDVDIGGYIEAAKKAVSDNLSLPAGYSLTWAGQYEFMQRVRDKLTMVLPLTIAVIFFMFYLNFKSVTKTLIVLLSVPFALTGSLWYLYILGYNLSVAVGVGMIALAGVAAETGVVMIVFLDEAYERFRAQGKLKSLEDLYQAITAGAVQRVRPKMMTVLTTILGLFPIMWGHGAGADTARRIAAPMIGGLISSTILTLIIIPSIYAIWKWQTELRKSVA